MAPCTQTDTRQGVTDELTRNITQVLMETRTLEVVPLDLQLLRRTRGSVDEKTYLSLTGLCRIEVTFRLQVGHLELCLQHPGRILAQRRFRSPENRGVPIIPQL